MKKLFMVLCIVIMFFGIVGCPKSADQPLSNNPGTTISGSNINSQIDGVNNGTSPVPEPATLILLGSGLVGLAGIGRKKFFKKD